jgi:hypothetical protein
VIISIAACNLIKLIEHVNGSLVTPSTILCPEIPGTNPAIGEISNFGKVFDGGGPWVVMKDLSVPLEQVEKEV